MYLKELSKKAAIYERLASALGMKRCCWVTRSSSYCQKQISFNSEPLAGSPLKNPNVYCKTLFFAAS